MKIKIILFDISKLKWGKTFIAYILWLTNTGRIIGQHTYIEMRWIIAKFSRPADSGVQRWKNNAVYTLKLKGKYSQPVDSIIWI